MPDALDLIIAAADLAQAARAIEAIRTDLGRLSDGEEEELLAIAARLRQLSRKIALLDQRLQRVLS
jgi:hypothetical protein